MRTFLCASALFLCTACPAPGDDDDSAWSPGVVYQYAGGDAAELEPNDSTLSAQDLGVVGSGFVVTGNAQACGQHGTWAGADTDWFRLLPETGNTLEYRLDMWDGDFDLAIFNEGEGLVVDAANAGLDDEVVWVALDPETPWLIRIRCWQGNPGALWRLRLD